MIGEVFRTRTRALDDLEQQHQDSERQQHIAQRQRPLGARHQRQLQNRIGEGNAGHQEDDDVVDRERYQKKRKTDHRHRRGLLSSRRTDAFPSESLWGGPQKNRLTALVGRILAEFRRALPVMSAPTLSYAAMP